jgi:DNA-directed RNA polymerase specialized sigma24 family protein
MHSDGSVTRWLLGLRDRDADSIREIWQRYFQRLVELARRQLHGRAWLGTDEQDVALSALHSFIQRTARGDFPNLDGRDELWRLLTVITRRKALNVIRGALTKRAGEGKVVELDLVLHQTLPEEPTPEQIAELLDEANQFLNVVLPRHDGKLRVVALRKLNGEENAQIARQLGVSRRTVERKLELIRLLWESEESSPS